MMLSRRRIVVVVVVVVVIQARGRWGEPTSRDDYYYVYRQSSFLVTTEVGRKSGIRPDQRRK
jgi:hypothetical protein